MNQNPFSNMADNPDSAAPSSNLSQGSGNGATAALAQTSSGSSPQNSGSSFLSSIANIVGSLSAEGNADKPLTNPMMNVNSAPQPGSSKEDEKDERAEMAAETAKGAVRTMVLGM